MIVIVQSELGTERFVCHSIPEAEEEFKRQRRTAQYMSNEDGIEREVMLVLRSVTVRQYRREESNTGMRSAGREVATWLCS